MTELEQLRADLATIQEAAEIAKKQGFHERTGNYDMVEGELKQKIADLEAQEQVDPWERARGYVDHALKHYLPSNGREIAKYARHLEAKVAQLEAQQAQSGELTGSKLAKETDSFKGMTGNGVMWKYVRHLETKVAELDNELRCERIDGGKVRDDLKAEIAELKAKAKREQLDFCEECGYPLSDCGPPSVDGTPTADCKVCQLKAQIAEMEQHGRKVDQANHEHYGRLQDQIAIRDLKIEKLEGQLAGRPVSEAAEALVKEMDEFKQRETLAEQEIRIRDAKLTVDFIVRNRPNGNPTACDIAHYARHLEDQLNVATIRNLRTDEQLREKLAELTTIANAIPPACGLAKEFVERRIEGVKKEMQGNGD